MWTPRPSAYEGNDDAVDLVFGSSIRADANRARLAVARFHVAFDGYQGSEYPSRVAFQVRIIHVMRQVTDRATMVVRLDVENLSERGGISLDGQAPVQEQHRNVRGGHEILEIVARPRNFFQ